MTTSRRKDFRLPDDLHYLNCAYMAPLPRVVEEVGIRALRRKRVPTKIRPEAFFEESDRLREVFARLIGIDDPTRIAIVPSASYGIAAAARNLAVEEDEEILVAEEQFPSNVYAWQRLAEERDAHLRTVEAPETRSGRGAAWNESILAAIGPRTAVVALPHVHWADGTRFDLEAIAERVHAHGGALVVDGTQSVGALPYDQEAIGADALVCAGYKWLLGPYSLGCAYFGDRFDEGRPLEENWIVREGSREFSGLVDYEERYQPGAVRYDVGERSNFILVPMLRRAIELLRTYDPEAIQAYCRDLTADTVAALQEAGWSVEAPAYRGHHLFGIRAPAEVDLDALEERLADRNVVVSVRGNAVRISPHLYNTERDLTALRKVML